MPPSRLFTFSAFPLFPQEGLCHIPPKLLALITMKLIKKGGPFPSYKEIDRERRILPNPLTRDRNNEVKRTWSAMIRNEKTLPFGRWGGGGV